jgi:hypothetical protein
VKQTNFVIASSGPEHMQHDLDLLVQWGHEQRQTYQLMKDQEFSCRSLSCS